MAASSQVLIVGAGPVGLALALALKRAGLTVELADAREAENSERDTRVLALSHGSRQTLERFDAWPESGATAIETIHISQRGALGRTEIRAADYQLPALGYVMPAVLLHRRLAQQVAAAGIPLTHGCAITALEPGSDSIRARDSTGRTLEAQLVACCEGRIGEADPSADFLRRDYGQHAIIARATPAQPHRGIAFERFTPEGPIALLPMGKDYSVVWTASPARSEVLLKQGESEFRAALQDAFGSRVQLLSTCERAKFPLGLLARHTPVGKRTVWLGNAAQTLHPVAGQGFNLALRDVWTLAETLTDSADAGHAEALSRYARKRLLDRSGTIGFTDTLVRMFSSDDPLLTHFRGAGLLALDVISPLRHFVAKRMLFGARAWP